MTTVYGVFNTSNAASSVIQTLNSMDIKSQDISIITKENSDLVLSKDDSSATGHTLDGVAAGGIVGGLVGLLVGLVAISVPPIGPLLIAGPIATALGVTGAAATATSGAVTGILAGGLVGSLLKLGLAKDEAELYEEKVMHGGILLGVSVEDGQEKQVTDVLKKGGAENVTSISK